jgi:diguanylate cyclase (GGDEF)-like protein
MLGFNHQTDAFPSAAVASSGASSPLLEFVVAAIESIADYLFLICDRAVSGGYLVAIALICALQYLYHLHSTRRAAEIRRRLCRQIDEVQKDLRVVSRDRTLTTLENQILREFTEELDIDRTIDQLIRRLVAETKNGFAAYISLGMPPRVTHSRGLADKSRDALVVDDAFLKRVCEEGVAMLRMSEIYGSKLYDSLSVTDRSRFDRLFLAGVGTADQLVGVIVTTSLIPSGIPLDQQLDLARRLVQSLTGVVKRSGELQERDKQLQSINEILELRAVTDQKHASPLAMIEAFVDRLRVMAQAERAVLFLIPPDGKGPFKPLCRCGNALPAGSGKKHADLEAILAETGNARNEPEMLDAAQLGRSGINSMIGSAIVAPVVSPNGIAGALCLTRAAREPFVAVRPELIRWASRYLSETLLRALHQALAEWHARQDPLTDLSNRRTFDSEFAAALQTASTRGTSCALLMVDIDRFKSVNDQHGHLVGDEVLRCVSRLLKETIGRLSTHALVARYGGEEFAVMLPGATEEEAAWMGESIRSAIEVMTIHTQQSQVSVTVSAGVAVFPEHARTGEELLTVADSALYHAKESGRNRVLTPRSLATT